MATLYKLTDRDGYTRAGLGNALLWGPGVSHTATGAGAELCSAGVIHAYLDPLLAVLLNPIHADMRAPRLWLAEGEIVAQEGQLKVGCKTLSVVKEIEVPEITPEQRARFAILCAKQVFPNTEWNAWADDWLSGKDRTQEAAVRAEMAAYEVRATAYAAAVRAEMAAYKVRATAYVAEATARTAARAAYVAEATARAARTAARAAYVAEATARAEAVAEAYAEAAAATAYAAVEAVTAKTFDLIAIARETVAGK